MILADRRVDAPKTSTHFIGSDFSRKPPRGNGWPGKMAEGASGVQGTSQRNGNESKRVRKVWQVSRDEGNNQSGDFTRAGGNRYGTFLNRGRRAITPSSVTTTTCDRSIQAIEKQAKRRGGDLIVHRRRPRRSRRWSKES